jgi:hypothetical protein
LSVERNQAAEELFMKAQWSRVELSSPMYLNVPGTPALRTIGDALTFITRLPIEYDTVEWALVANDLEEAHYRSADTALVQRASRSLFDLLDACEMLDSRHFADA